MLGQTMVQSDTTIYLLSINSTTCFGQTGHYQVGKNGRRIYCFEWKLSSQLRIFYYITYNEEELNNHV
jgi:hypothetical protein